MKIILNEVPLELTVRDGVKYLPLARLQMACRGKFTPSNICKRNIQPTNLLLEGAGRCSVLLVDQTGAADWILASLSVGGVKEKQEILNTLLKQGFLEEPYKCYNTRAELEFYSVLKGFCTAANLHFTTQVTLEGLAPIYDFQINNLLVEFDENGHNGYCKKSESSRELYARSKGFKFIRLASTDSWETNLGILHSKLTEDV